MSENRKGFTQNYDILLYEEVNGVCPKCLKSLMQQKGDKKIKQFEKAHIYPLNPTPEEIELLKNEKRLSDDVNHINNLIALCKACHDYFDNPRTVDEYQKMYRLKETLINDQKSKSVWSEYPLEKQISVIIDELANDTDIDYEDLLELNPKTIDDKTNQTLRPITKKKIKTEVTHYYNYVKLKLKEVDSLNQTSSELIAQQIKTYYLKTSSIYTNQEEIYNALVQWLHRKSNSISIDASSIIISFFIQNCEIFK